MHVLSCLSVALGLHVMSLKASAELKLHIALFDF